MTTTNGSFYIDNLTHDFYLRENDAWVLKGNIGPNGGAGFGPPPASPTPEGLYIDIEAGDIYVAGVVIGTLSGGAGAGPAGKNGLSIPGIDGEDGDSWMIPGRPGTDGASVTGPAGADGLSIPGMDGEDGEAWSIPGRSGIDGADGQSIPGLDGEDGDSWPIPGRPGTDGESVTGPAGADGHTVPGFDGEDGDSSPVPGRPGTDGADGRSVPGLDGKDGDSWLIPGRPGADGLNAVAVPGRDGEDGESAQVIPGKDGRSSGQRYQFNSSTLTNTDPGDGMFTLNNTPQSGAWSVMSISRKNADGVNIAALLQAMMNSGTECVFTFRSADGSKIVQGTIVASSLVDNTTYYTLTVSPMTGSSGIGSGLEMYLEMGRSGTDAGFRFTFSTNTASSDPGAGKFQVNNALWGSATTVSFSNTDGRGVNVRAALRRLMNTGTQCVAQGFTRDGTRQYPFLVLVTGFVDNTTYDTYGIQPISGGVPTNNDVVFFTFSKFGDQGLQGVSIGIPGRDGEDADPWPTPFAINSPVARTTLGADKTYYVRTDGNDSNTGLTNTAAGAFLTVQKAVDFLCSIDLSVYQATIQIVDGTYTGNVILKLYVGALSPIIRGNNSTPANVLLTSASGHAIYSDCATKWRILDLKLAATNGDCIHAAGGLIFFGNLDFGVVSAGYHLYSEGGGFIKGESNYTVTGGGAAAHYAAAGGQINVIQLTVSVPNSIAITNFALANRSGGSLDAYGMTFTGAGVVTGNKYSASINGSIVALSTVFPGTVAGTTGSGGVYF